MTETDQQFAALAPRHGVPWWLAFPALVVAIAALLTVGDYVAHVDSGVLSYREPDRGSLFPGQPTAEVFLGFLQLAVGIVVLGWVMFRGTPAPGWRKAVMSVGLFFVLYYLSGVFREHPMGLYVAFMLIWLPHLSFTGLDLRKLVVLSVLLGVLGPVAEGVKSDSGFFAYADQDAFYVPLWLSALYLNGAIGLAALVSTVDARRRR